jgi:hypothetical protein
MMKKIIYLIILIIPLLFPQVTLADCRSTGCPTPPKTYCEPGTWICTTPLAPGGCTGTPGFVCSALGDIPTDPTELVKWILKNAIIMGGGIAFLLSMWGGITIILNGGNPEKINEGKEIIGSAITGLLFIVFSVFLLRFIGFDVLQLPGFSNP